MSTALTAHAVRRLRGRVAAESNARDLLILASRLREEILPIQQRYRLRFEAPYPGLTAGPEAVRSGYRIVLACRAFHEEEKPLGVVFTTLIPSRLPQVSVAPAETAIPEAWRPAAEPF